jgi:hypothetical protein
VKTSQATAFGDYYLFAGAELWEESNDIPGLQRFASSCIGRASLPADTCVTHTENGALVGCLSEYPYHAI